MLWIYSRNINSFIIARLSTNDCRLQGLSSVNVSVSYRFNRFFHSSPPYQVPICIWLHECAVKMKKLFELFVSSYRLAMLNSQ